MHSEEKITAELLLIRHPDTDEDANKVGRPNVAPRADCGTQLAYFFEQANERALQRYVHFDPGYDSNNLRHIDKALSSPRIRAIMAWADVLLLVDGVTNNTQRFESQKAVDRWIEGRTVAKLEQEGLSSLTCGVDRVRTLQELLNAYDTILTIEEEIRRELLSIPRGVQVDDRLRDTAGSKAHDVGISRETYENSVDMCQVKEEHWHDLYDFLHTAIMPGKRQRGLERPMRAVAITHGKNLGVLEMLIQMRGHEASLVGKTYGDIKEELGTIPNGSGLQVFARADGTLEANRIYVPTNIVKQERIERGIQPQAPTYLSAEIIDELWRGDTY